MRKFYLLFTALFIQFLAIAQTDINIGSSATTNTGTNYPAALQDYYEGSRMQHLYLASELTAAGMTPGNITAVKYNVTSLNNFTGFIEQYTLSIGGTTTATLANSAWETGAATVFGPVDFAPVAGVNVITFTTPFFWNGTDNILIETCNGDPNNGTSVTYTQNVSTPVTTGLSFNGSHSYRADNLGTLCGIATTTNNGLQTSRPDIIFEWTAVTGGCFLPTGVTILNIMATTADVSWTAPAVGSAPASYNYEVRTSGAPGSGASGLTASGNATGTTVSLSALSSGTSYSFYIQSDCGAGSTSSWSSAYAINTPATCIEPTFLVHSNVTVSTAQINWTAPATAPASYELYSSTSNVVPTSTTTPTILGITATIANFTALLSATKYFVWVRSNCGAGGVSGWSVADSFTTSCTEVSAFSENFDAVTSPDFPTCWAKVGVSGTASVQTGTYQQSGNNYLLLYGTSVTDQAVVSMPLVNYAGNNSQQLKFSIRSRFTAGATVQVGYLTNPSDSSTFVSLQDIVTVGITYQTFTVIPTGVPGSIVVFAFRHTGVGAYSTAIDDVSWEPIPNCVEPTTLVHSNITTTGAQMDWTAPAIAPASYELYYSTSNVAPTATTTPTTSGITVATANLTGLASATQYFIWVRSNCGTGGVSGWSVADSFYTQCNATNVPYTQDFETAVVPNVPPCTNIQNVGFGNDWITATNPGSGFTTTVLKYGYETNNNADAWFYTQGLNLTAGTIYRLTFSYGNNSTTYTEKMNVSYGDAANAGNMTNLIVDYDSIYDATLHQSSTDFTPTASGVYYIGFHAYSAANQWNLYVDSIAVNLAPVVVCTEPTALVHSNVTATSAQIDWTAPATAPASYELYSSTSSTAPTSSTIPTTIGIATTTTNLTGFAAGTKYFVWVRSNCGTGGGGVSIWSVVDSFTTATVCTAPTALVHSNVTATSAQIDWTAPATAPATYELYSSTSSTAPTSSTTPTTTGIATTTTNLTGLAAGTKYYAWIRSNCGSSTISSWSIADSFTTIASGCIAVSAFSENFDAVTVPALPLCWARVGLGGTGVRTQTATPSSSPNTVYIYSSTTTSLAILATQPVTSASTNTNWLRFDARGNFTAGANLEVGYLTNPTDSSTFVSLQTVNIGSLTYQNYTVIPGPITGSPDVTLAFRHTGAPSYSVLIDNIVWEPVPSCLPPTAIVHSNVLTTSAQIDWTAPVLGSPVSYDVYSSTSNVAPIATTTPTITGVAGTTTTLNSLIPSTQYFVWVRSNCGAGSYSSWSAADSFITACVAVTTINENFDGVTPPALPNCWSKILRGSTLATAATVQTLVGTAYSTPNSLRMYNAGSGTTDDIILVSPALSNLSAGTYQLSFYAKTGTLGENLEVGTLDNNSATALFTPLETINTLTTTYQKFSVSFAAYTGTDTYIGVRRATSATFTYIYIDDIKWELIPTCFEPTSVTATNVTINTAQVDWLAPITGTPTSYEVYYSTNPTAPTGTTTPTLVGITGTTANLTGLSASSAYCVWIRSNCGTGGVSSWSVSACFNTPCGPVAAPTAAPENFAGAGFPPNCWSRATGLLANPSTLTTATTVWVLDDYGNVTSPVNKSAKINIYGTTRKHWLLTPTYDLGAGGNYKLDFDLAMTKFALTDSGGLGSDDKFAVVISTDNGVTWSGTNVLRMWDTTTALHPGGEHISIDLASYTGLVMFGFYGESTITGNGDNDVFVDNVEIVQAPFAVTLITFKGEKQGSHNLLTWSTANEHNNKGFELQRSADGEHFSAITFVKSKAMNGNSSAALTYNFADEKPFAGNSYYRLKQVDNDGKTTLSNIVLIKGNRGNSIVLSSVYPSPTSSKLNVVLSALANDKVTLVITDMTGKVIIQQTAQLLNGDNNVSLNVSALSSGAYLVKAICNNGCETAVSKFVKK